MTNAEFTNILKPHYNDAVNYCRALCSGNSQAEAEEVLQQALIKAYQNITSLKEPEKFRSWLFQIITRSFYNSVRRPFWNRFVSLTSSEGNSEFAIYETDYFEDNQLLVAALSRLEAKERSSILLFEIGGFSIKEITEIQKENSESAVKSRLSRTRKKLKEFMEQLEEVNPETVSRLRPKSILKTNDLYHETSEIINKFKSMG